MKQLSRKFISQELIFPIVPFGIDIGVNSGLIIPRLIVVSAESAVSSLALEGATDEGTSLKRVSNGIELVSVTSCSAEELGVRM
jgi:hypothetical protein